MIKKHLLLLIVIPLISTVARAEEFKNLWHSFSSASGRSVNESETYVNTSNFGQAAVGNSMGKVTFTRLFAGALSAEMDVQQADSDKIGFDDVKPPEEKWNDTYRIKCAITIEAYENEIATHTVKFSISTSGLTTANFSDWTDEGLTVEEEFSASKIRYSVTIPTAPGGVSFASGPDNYIKWQARDTKGNSNSSDPRNIKITHPDIKIVQPKDITSVSPAIELNLAGPVNPDTVKVKVEKKNGQVVYISDQGHYDPETGKYRKEWDQPPLAPEENFFVTVSVEDGMGKLYEDTAEFKTASGVIADLIPVPSPADISREEVIIRYALSDESEVYISIYDAAGNFVREIVGGDMRPAGVHMSDTWDGKNYAGRTMANGVYFCEVRVINSGEEYRRYTSLAILR